MIKFFIIASLFLALVLIIFAYRYKGTSEYEENFFGMKVMFVAYLIIGTMMIMYQPEIKSLFRGEKKVPIEQTKEVKKEKSYERSYVEGYLKKGTAWYYGDTGKIYYNSDKVKVEIWGSQLVMSDGSKLTQIFFLEGTWAGVWGYTLEEFLIREK